MQPSQLYTSGSLRQRRWVRSSVPGSGDNNRHRSRNDTAPNTRIGKIYIYRDYMPAWKLFDVQ